MHLGASNIPPSLDSGSSLSLAHRKVPPSSQEPPHSSTAFVRRRMKLPWEVGSLREQSCSPSYKQYHVGMGQQDAGTSLCIQERSSMEATSSPCQLRGKQPADPDVNAFQGSIRSLKVAVLEVVGAGF